MSVTTGVDNASIQNNDPDLGSVASTPPRDAYDIESETDDSPDTTNGAGEDSDELSMIVKKILNHRKTA